MGRMGRGALEEAVVLEGSPPLMLREVGTKLRELWFVWGCVGGANVGVISELRYAPCK